MPTVRTLKILADRWVCCLLDVATFAGEDDPAAPRRCDPHLATKRVAQDWRGISPPAVACRTADDDPAAPSPREPPYFARWRVLGGRPGRARMVCGASSRAASGVSKALAHSTSARTDTFTRPASTFCT